MRAPELQFVCGTCDVTDCIHAEGILDSFLFLLDIFTLFSSYQTYYRIGEKKALRFVGNAKG